MSPHEGIFKKSWEHGVRVQKILQAWLKILEYYKHTELKNWSDNWDQLLYNAANLPEGLHHQKCFTGNVEINSSKMIHCWKHKQLNED